MSLRAITYVNDAGAPGSTPAPIGLEMRNTLIATLGAVVLSAGIGAVMGGTKGAITGGLLVGGLTAAVGGASVGWRAQSVVSTYTDVRRTGGIGEDATIQESSITLTTSQGDPAVQRWIGFGTAAVGAGALAFGAYRWSKR